MSIAVLGIVVLVVLFIVSTALPFNIGTLAFAASYVIGVMVGGLSINDVFAAFPTNLFVLLAGITYFFAIAEGNGTLKQITNTLLGLGRGNAAVIPWVFFVVASVISGLGAGPAASTAILAPLAASAAATASIPALLMGVVLIHGSHSGSMAPISALGALVNGVVTKTNIPDVSVPLFLNSLVFNIFLAVAAFLLFGGIGLLRRARTASFQAGSLVSGSAAQPWTRYQLTTLGAILLLIVLAVGFKLDVGLTAFVLGVLLVAVAPSQEDRAIGKIAWPVIVMMCGILTFVGVIDKLGSMKMISNAITSLNAPLLAPLLIAMVGSITSLFSATGAVLGATIPMLPPVINSLGITDPSGVVSTLAIASSVVDTSPFSLQGALILGAFASSQQVRGGLFARLLAWGVAMVFVGSILPWLFLVVLRLQ